MNLFFTFFRRRLVMAATLISVSCFAPHLGVAQTETAPLLLDDFSDSWRTAQGAEPLLVDDKGLGSTSQATQTCVGGVLAVKGELVPGRGSPAFISLVLLVSTEGKPRDLSGYAGVRLRVKVSKGNLSVQVSSSEIKNLDYHTSAPIGGKRGEFQDVRISFNAMKRGWSEQSVLDQKTITSVNLVAVAMAREAFAYEVDKIGFY